MNRLLVTGLGPGYDLGVCSVCNADLDWIMQYPSILLWADKIIFTPAIWDSIQKERSETKEAAKCFKLIFDIAETNGIIEISNPSEIFDDSLEDMIDAQIEKDINSLKIIFPEKVKEKHIGKTKDVDLTETIIDGIGYCPPYIWAIYANIILARMWNANCLFNEHSLHFCRYKFGISGFPQEVDVGLKQSFATLFKSFLPNDTIIPKYVFADKNKCKQCKSEQKCNDTYLIELEKKVLELFKWREYDELQQVKSVINTIADKHAKSNGLIVPDEVINDFNKEKKKIQKRIRSVFPKVRRWVNITTVLSIPIAVVGLATSNPLITLTGATTVGVSQAAKELIEFLKNKYRWVGFIPENIDTTK
ncbi:MAG: hypothetical protein HWN66_20080 [Candidatus Helarchaeota archaeon]|nr:hypothetical protein [Candidatus Helarchaeota archaeon]